MTYLKDEENAIDSVDQNKRLKKRIEIAESGNKRSIWNQEPIHDHDKDIFNTEKNNLYGKLRYNLSGSDEASSKRKHHNKDKKIEKIKKNKKVKKIKQK